MSGECPKIAILTVSDRGAAGEAEDGSGPALVELVERVGLGKVCATKVVSDEIDAIRGFVRDWSRGDDSAALILTTGGTGLAPRDNTPEAVSALFTKPAPNLMELARLRCFEKTPLTYLSRGVAGVVDRTLVITLPGSPKGAVEQLEAILDILPHAMETARDGGQRLHPPRV